MSKVKYLMDRLLRMNHRRMLRTVEMIHCKTGRSRLWVLGDMIRCGLRYGAGYTDYLLCGFYDLTPAQRSTYVTRGVNNRIVRLCNDPAWYHCVEDKRSFNRIYGAFVRRGWLDMNRCTYDAFAEFMDGRDTIISKPAACRGTTPEIEKLMALTAESHDLFVLGSPALEERRAGSDWRHSPIMI